MGRREFLIGAGGLASVGFSYTLSNRILPAESIAKTKENLFSLGVASGDPSPDGFVLWTRLAPDPLNGGGMPNQQVPVQWQVATDEKMRRVVRQGTALAIAEYAHSVHVEVAGLKSARWYWYQFKVGSQLSPIGRTRTTPAIAARVNRLRFAFASCQNYEHGYYTAYRDMVKADLDFVVFLGDYIYEGAAKTGKPRQHNGPEAITLEQYRNRYALYKTDPDLQAAHAAFPWIVTPDDHEVENNYADLIPADNESQTVFTQRRADAYQAYYEHMPLRRSSLPKGFNIKLYRRFSFGDLAELSVLDTRQYRSNQPCGDGGKPRCSDAFAQTATMTGSVQEQWLLQGLSQSESRWNVIAQQTMMAQFGIKAGSSTLYNLDQWDGYVAARNRLLKFLDERKPSNPIVITGDIHSSWVQNLKVNFDRPDSAIVATEFVGTSISSDFPKERIPFIQAALSDNPHTQFFEGKHRGYVLCSVTPQEWRADIRVVSTSLEPNGKVSTLASFIVESGQPGAKQA
jgi:alkaline phosphatase D